MKKRVISLFAATVFAVAGMNLVSAEANDKHIIYVSPSGNDSNPGTIERPLKTLQNAKEKAALLIAESDIAVEVVFREGEYRFSESVDFTAADSGTAEKPVVYKAYEGENVEFKGSLEVDSSKGKRVTDETVLSRMYESVRNKVVCFNLEALGIKKDMVRMPGNNDGWRALINGEVNGIYIDGTEQTVAQWPNGEGVYTRWENAVDANTIQYEDMQPNRWGKAKNFWLGGYNSYDYYYIRQSVTDVNTDEKTISIYTQNSAHQFTSHQSRRWKAINLLEEIDIPGEYYIDTDSMMLYLYPTHSLKDAKMEISWLNVPMISLKNTQNVKFEGITFTQTRGNAIDMTDVDNIDIVGCRFENILGQAVNNHGTVNAQTDKDYWQVCEIDGSYNCDITGNVFNNIGGGAIILSGGNVDTLTKSNNVISDNMIYRASQLSKNQNAILLYGCGHTVVNNNISKCPFQAIRFYGNDNIIQYNEIYNVNQESDDCGAIYCGRNSIQRGTEISYNFLHDLLTTEELPFGFQSAIYWDDNQTGISAHHNIIKNARIDLASNGSVDCNFSENISIDIGAKRWHYINGGYSVNHNGGEAAANYKFGSYIANPELYYEHYPTLKEMFNYRCDDPELAKFNKLKNNLAVNSVEATTGTNTLKYGDISGNLEISECGDFVDPEHQDYRIKSNSETAKKVKGILTDEFDIEQIGLINDVALNEKTAAFRQIYPSNGATAVQLSNLELVWENALGATKYRVVMATDPEFKNVIYEEEVPYTVTKVEGLKNNQAYYWKVYAVNSSRELYSEWESASCVYSFKTAMYDEIDTTYLDYELEKIKKDVIKIDEGGEPGQYPYGTAEKINMMIKRANLIKNSKLGIINQKSIDAITNSLSSSFNKIGMVNKGFLDIKEYINDQSDWSGDYETSDGVFSVTGNASKVKQAGTKTLSATTGSCIYSFDAKVDVDNWCIIAFSKFTDMVPYSSANTGYSICVKDDLVELQLSTGNSHDVVETVYKSFANDGEYHHIEFGFVDIEIGNLIVLYVDGESWIEYLDILNTSVKNTCELSMFIVNKDSDMISIKPSEYISSKDEFEALIKRNLYKSVQIVLEQFETDDEVILFKKDSTKIFSPKGVFDVSYAPNKVINGKLMMAFDKIDDIFGVETAVENGKFYIVAGTKQQVTEVSEQNGYTMVSVEEVLKVLGRANVSSAAHNMIISGNIIYMNNVAYLNKASTLMRLLDLYYSDYLFDNN